MDAYLIIGNPNTRKSSVVRSLTGCFNRSVRDIQFKGGKAPVRLYARARALQDTRTTIDEFLAEVQDSRCTTVLCCLWPSAHPNSPGLHPDALEYLARFKSAGWRIRSVAVLGQNGGGVRGPGLGQFPQASTAPINLTAQAVRAHFGWQ